MAKNVIRFDANATDKSVNACFRIPEALHKRMNELAASAKSAGGKLEYSPIVRAALQRACDDAEQQLASLQKAA
jgi:hypothetical protein